MKDIARWELALSWLPRATGFVVAAVAAGGLLFRALGKATVAELAPTVVAFLAGVALIHSHWSYALVLGLLPLALLVRSIVRPNAPANGTSDDPAPPPSP